MAIWVFKRFFQEEHPDGHEIPIDKDESLLENDYRVELGMGTVAIRDSLFALFLRIFLVRNWTWTKNIDFPNSSCPGFIFLIVVAFVWLDRDHLSVFLGSYIWDINDILVWLCKRRKHRKSIQIDRRKVKFLPSRSDLCTHNRRSPRSLESRWRTRSRSRSSSLSTIRLRNTKVWLMKQLRFMF